MIVFIIAFFILIFSLSQSIDSPTEYSPLEEPDISAVEEESDAETNAEAEDEVTQISEQGEEDDEVYVEEFPELEQLEEISPMLITFGILFTLLYLFSSIVASQFVFVKTTNHTLTNTTLGSCRLHSDMRVRDMIWIMIRNFFLCVITLGIYFPWAMVRLRKYRIEHMKLFTYGELEEFIATKESEQDALGDAAGDYLDFEFGF